MRRRRILSGSVAFLLLAPACTSDGEADPPPIPNDPPTGSATPTEPDTNDEIDVSTVPSDLEDIDVEYVQAVMDELNSIIHGAVIIFREAGDIEHPNLREMIFAAYTEESGDAQLETLAGLRADRVPPNPGAPTSDVEEILELQDRCIVFAAERTWRPIMTEDVDYEPIQPYYLRLVPNEPNETNTTAWKLDFDGYLPDSAQEPEGGLCAR